MFISDWTDTGDYHNRTGENRLSGRIYKITYGDAKPSIGSDMTKLTVESSSRSILTPTSGSRDRPAWSFRTAWSMAAASATRGSCCATSSIARRTSPRKLRALWTLYTIGGADEAFLLPLLKSPNEHLRAWGIRLLSEHWPLDALLTNDEAVPGATRIWTQQRPAPAVGGAEPNRSPAVLAELDATGAHRFVEPCPAGACVDDAADVVQPAAGRGARPRDAQEDATDKNLPLMVWYALIPIAETIPPRSRRSRRKASCARPASTSPAGSPKTSRRDLVL